MLVKKYLNGVEILSVDKNRLKELLKKIASYIKVKHSEVKEIILFGSFSRNDFTPYSDVDIAIIVDDSDKEFIRRQDEFIGYFEDMEFDTNILVYTQKEIKKMQEGGNKFIEEIKEGERL